MAEVGDLGPWRGVLIEESLEDPTVLNRMHIVGTMSERLEGEEDRGEFHFHKVEVDNDALKGVLQDASESIKDSWYFHLVSGDRMIVVFRGRVFEATKGRANEFDAIRAFALSQGIHPEQLQLERLMDNPYDE